MNSLHSTSSSSPQAPAGATLILLAGLAITWVAANGHTPSELASYYAYGVGLSFALSLLVDYRRNIRNLVRADIMALSSLYFLTLAEYVVPQPQIDQVIEIAEIMPALTACVVGFAALAVGRHFTPRAPASLTRLAQATPPRAVLITLFGLCFFGGFANMIIAVDFDLGAMIHYFMTPRFTQPWGRGRFGDWRALLYEISMVLYLVPPIAGVVLAERRRFSTVEVACVIAGTVFTFFYGYTSGTRNIFATYLATFLVAYSFAAGRERRKEILLVVGAGSAAMIYATTAMLEFRSVGFEAYMQGVREFGPQDNSTPFFVDNNLYNIARLIEVFPAKHDYLGLEVPYLALIRPIPRALWPGKPEGMSMSIEDALGAGEGFTLAATFVGEAHMSGGTIGIVICGLLLGGITSWWNQLAQDDNSSFGYLIFASGFFAAVITMRSIFMFTTAILPTVTAVIFGHWIVQTVRERRAAEPDTPPDA